MRRQYPPKQRYGVFEVRKLGWIDEVYNEETKNPDAWLPVNTSDFSQDKRERFRRRKRGLDLYLKTDTPIPDILDQAGL